MSALQQMVFGVGLPSTGQVEYTTPGTYAWICPEGVSSVSVVAVGAGGCNAGSVYWGAGAGGALDYVNNIPVTPGLSYAVVVGAGKVRPATGQAGSSSFGGTTVLATGGWSSTSTSACAGGSKSHTGGAGGAGGTSGTYNGGGGGAGGYAGAGGAGANGASVINLGNAGSGGGGGGASAVGAPGGGVGLLGQGASGAGGTLASGYESGRGGSGGADGAGSNGGAYGGGGGEQGGNGAVRIIWPGADRQFPSTRTANK